MQTKPATNVTASSATLNAQVSCGSAPYGPVWWELREAGTSQWRLVGAEQTISCPRGVSPNGPPATMPISEPVDGLRPGVAYEFRVGVDPPGAGPLVYSTGHGLLHRRQPHAGRGPGSPTTLRAGGSRLQLRG